MINYKEPAFERKRPHDGTTDHYAMATQRMN